MEKITCQVNDILKNNNTLSNDFGDLSKVYMMTTENIYGYLKGFDLKDKDVLTVCGSGDQLLNAYLLGAKNVSCFDINSLSFLQVKLKKSAVCTLSHSEFLDFFDVNSDNFLNYYLYKKISKFLDLDTKSLFDYLFLCYSRREIFNKIYYRFDPDFDRLKNLNFYLDKDNFYTLKKTLKEKDTEFIHTDITNLKNNLENRKFDVILLSNISDSIESIYPVDSLKQYKRLIHSLAKHLNSYGIIQTGYIYDYDNTRHKNIFARKKERQKVFTSDEFYTILVDSYNEGPNRDEVVVFQKKR